MSNEDKVIAALNLIKSSIRHIRRRSMRLGRYTNGVLDTTVNATLPANYVWVFDPQGDKRVSSPAKNLSTEYGPGMAVIVAYNVDTQEDDVIGVDTVLGPLEQGSAAAGLNSPQKPAGIPTPISARDITVGGVFAASAGGLDVRIGAYWHENGYYADSIALTLTPTATSSKKSFAIVGVNRLTNAATYTLTADRSSAFTLIADGRPNSYAVTDIMAVVDAAPEIDWRGAVELKNGDTTINPAKIVALNWLKAELVGADGAAAGVAGLVPKPAAADNTRFLRGDATWQEIVAGVNGSICLYHADGSDPETFTVDSTGLDDASAAAAAGDVIWLPPCSIASNHTLTADVEYVGAGREQTILTGQLTLADGVALRNLSIIRSASSSSALIGLLMETDAATARAYQCTMDVTNSGSGDAYAVQGADGTISLHECTATADASTGDGYGTYATAGAIFMYGGVRSGSTADGQVGSVTPTIPPGGDPAYFANNGTNQAIFPNIISPSSYTYNGVTYVVYMGASFGIYIDAYDHAARTWAGAELVRSNPGSFDDHSTPSVIVDNSGYIEVFFGGSSGASLAMYRTRSNNPEDITAWTNQSNIGSNTTYHSLVKLADGTIYVFYTKASGFLHTYYVRSDESYGTEHLAHSSGASGDSIYFGNPVYDETRGRIWLMWSYYEISVTARRYLFVAYLDLSDGHWYGGMDDADLGTSTTTAEWVASCQLLSSSYETNHPNLFLDTSDNLHIEYNVKDGGVWKHAYRKWNGTSWGSIELITTANHQFNMGDIYANADGTVDAYLVTNASAVRGGDLEHWQRSVGGAWSLIRTIFSKATYATHDGAMYPTVNRSDPSGTIRVVFADEESTPTSNDLLVYAVDINDTYVISNPGAAISLNAVRTTVTDTDTALAGDRSAFDTVSFPALHAKDIADAAFTVHLPTPSAAGQVAISVSDGVGGFYWEAGTTGTVTTVTASDPLSSTGGATPNITHDASGAVAGTYSNPNVTVDTYGHVTAIADGTGGGAEHVHGLARWVADGSAATFDLPDVAEYLEMVFNAGLAVDQTTVTLSADGTQITFDAAPTAANVLQAQYVIARI